MIDREWMQKHQEERNDAWKKWQHDERQSDKRWRVIELLVIAVITIVAAALGWLLRGLR